MTERNTGPIIRDSGRKPVPYGPWAGTYIGVTVLISFLIIGHLIGLWWIFPAFGLGLVWCAATAHGFRHGWLK